MDTVIRLLEPTDAEAFRDLRLAALQTEPKSFGASPEEESYDLDRWSLRLQDDDVFGAWRGPELVGIAGLSRAAMAKKRHRGFLWGVYVRPDARGSGVGRALIGAVIDHARQLVEVLETDVVTDNAAQQLYYALGFIPYGLEKNAIHAEGQIFDIELLALHFVDRPVSPKK